MKDYYSILGVPHSATPTEIRRAFRRLALEHHPDVNKSPGAADRFREINTAYQVLMDAEKRADYDASQSSRRARSDTSHRQSSRRESSASQPVDSQQSARHQYFQRRVRSATDRRGTWNYYDVLGVPHNATEETIVQAYQRLYQAFYAGRTHDPGTADILREIIEAREVLTDPARRLAYDNDWQDRPEQEERERQMRRAQEDREQQARLEKEELERLEQEERERQERLEEEERERQAELTLAESRRLSNRICNFLRKALRAKLRRGRRRVSQSNPSQS